MSPSDRQMNLKGVSTQSQRCAFDFGFLKIEAVWSNTESAEELQLFLIITVSDRMHMFME